MLCSLLYGAILGVPSAKAQQTQDHSSAPIPAYRSPLASMAGSDAEVTNADPQRLEPDKRSLAGAQGLSIGIPPAMHSYWQPRLEVKSTGDSNALTATNQSGWTTYTSLLAGVDLHRISGNSDLTLSYVGAGTVSNDSNVGNSITQDFELGEKVSFRRSAISFFDQLTYIPEAAFGYGGVGGLTLPVGRTIGVQNGFLPGQTILTTRGQRLANSFLTQLDTYLSPRSSFTFVGGYSLLNYFDNNLLNYGDAIFQAGYNHQVTRQDTLAVFYRFSLYRYSGFNQSINDNSFQASYGRQVTGRLAFQLAAGPDVAFLKTPTSASFGTSGGSGGIGATTTSSTTRVYWSLNTSLTYQLQRTGLRIAYSHGLGGGSGVLAGAITDTVFGSTSRQLSRTFMGGFSVGYARNRALFIARPTTTANQTFDYWFTGANFSHPWGRSLNLSLTYQLQYQTSNSSFCLGPTCGQSFVRHMVSIGMSWRDHPVPF